MLQKRMLGPDDKTGMCVVQQGSCPRSRTVWQPYESVLPFLEMQFRVVAQKTTLHVCVHKELITKQMRKKLSANELGS